MHAHTIMFVSFSFYEVTRSGSSVSLKQPLWNLPSQGESFRGSTPDLSASRRPLERTSSLSKTRPASSYMAAPSASQPTPPAFKPISSPPTMTPPPPPPPSSLLHQELASNKPPPLPTGPPPPPPQITKPTWLPVQPHSIPMPTVPPPPPPPLVPPSSLSDRSSGFFYSLPPSPKLKDAKFCNFRDSPPPPPPPFPASFTPSLPASLPPPPPPPPPKAPAVSTYRPAVPLLPPSYPCTAPSRKPPAIPGSAGTRPEKVWNVCALIFLFLDKQILGNSVRLRSELVSWVVRCFYLYSISRIFVLKSL